jgi:hypothetical protein
MQGMRTRYSCIQLSFIAQGYRYKYQIGVTQLYLKNSIALLIKEIPHIGHVSFEDEGNSIVPIKQFEHMPVLLLRTNSQLRHKISLGKIKVFGVGTYI